MTPLPVEPLFALTPGFFAHPLLSRPERQTARQGDWAKVVFRLPSGELKQVWLVVESVNHHRPGAGYVGRLAPWGFGTPLETLLAGPVRFGTDHVYRLLTSHN